jgi:hypothetical protein
VEHVHSRESDASGEAASGRSSAIGLWHGTYPLWTRQQRTPQRHPARAQAGRWASWRAVLAVVAEQEREKERDEGRGARGGGPLETGWPGLLPADLTSEQSRIEARKNRINSNRCPSQATPCETGLTTPWPVDLGPLSGSFLPRRRNKSYLVCRSVPGTIDLRHVHVPSAQPCLVLTLRASFAFHFARLTLLAASPLGRSVLFSRLPHVSKAPIPTHHIPPACLT